MSYAVELADAAIEDLNALPPVLTNLVEQQLNRLARDPVRLSKPAHFPYWQVQAYRFDAVYNGVTYYFTVLFQYGADERTLNVLAIPRLPGGSIE